jgi:hypothetical protein
VPACVRAALFTQIHLLVDLRNNVFILHLIIDKFGFDSETRVERCRQFGLHLVCKCVLSDFTACSVLTLMFNLLLLIIL